jgi:16S rRNA (uracil1498-N3)-methyltransferase
MMALFKVMIFKLTLIDYHIALRKSTSMKFQAVIKNDLQRQASECTLAAAAPSCTMGANIIQGVPISSLKSWKTKMRHFIIAHPAAIGDRLGIDGTDAHHIKRVLRLTVGDRIGLFDGSGGTYEAQIEKETAGGVQVKIVAKQVTENPPAFGITLAQAYLKDKKMDTLVRQLTELGTACWIPFFSERSVPKPDARRLAARSDRWQKISREAVKQCKSGRTMTVMPAISFSEMLACSRGSELRLLFWEKKGGGFVFDRSGFEKGSRRRIFAVLGPEGGFSEKEVRKATAAGFVTAGLGPRILRAETAAVAAVTLLQFLFGDMGKST